MMIKSSIVIFFVASLFMNCKGSKNALFENETPFTVKDVYFQKWVAGVQGGGSGINLYLTLTTVEEGVNLRSIFFKGKSAQIESNPNTPNVLISRFPTNQNRDIIMDGNAIDEFQNTPPEKLPFELHDNDAVISYNIKGTLKYYKIENIKEKPMLAYPSANTKQ